MRLALRQIRVSNVWKSPKRVIVVRIVYRVSFVDLLKPKTYFMYHQLFHSEILCSAHNAFMCFAWISEQTAIFPPLYSNNWRVFVADSECLLRGTNWVFNPLKPELNPICYLLALLGAYHFLHVSRMRVKLLTFRRLMSYIYGAPILDVSRSHTTTQHSR